MESCGVWQMRLQTTSSKTFCWTTSQRTFRGQPRASFAVTAFRQDDESSKSSLPLLTSQLAASAQTGHAAHPQQTGHGGHPHQSPHFGGPRPGSAGQDDWVQVSDPNGSGQKYWWNQKTHQTTHFGEPKPGSDAMSPGQSGGSEEDLSPSGKTHKTSQPKTDPSDTDVDGGTEGAATPADETAAAPAGEDDTATPADQTAAAPAYEDDAATPAHQTAAAPAYEASAATPAAKTAAAPAGKEQIEERLDALSEEVQENNLQQEQLIKQFRELKEATPAEEKVSAEEVPDEEAGASKEEAGGADSAPTDTASSGKSQRSHEYFSAPEHEYVAVTKVLPRAGKGEEPARIDLETLAKQEDPQLDRISKEVQSKLESVESRLENKDLQNVVIPMPDTYASEGAPSVKLVVGKQSSTNPDVGSPLDEVNKLIQRVDNVQRQLVQGRTESDSLEATPAGCPLAFPGMTGFRLRKADKLGCCSCLPCDMNDRSCACR